ncbi:signal recognition particle protein [bacterium]|nr:signal recognition particle protein [bacterium]
MFENLTDRLNQALRRVRGQSHLTEKNIQEALREVRLAFLEADVHVGAVKEFIARVRERALGQEVLASLEPGQHAIKVVYEELTRMLGGDALLDPIPAGGLIVTMLCGLQGSGKTTACAKLALKMKNEGRRPLLVAADVYRPAAVEQLKVLGEKVDVPVFSQPQGARPEQIVERAMAFARAEGRDLLILDTAGRLHIDERMMDELVRIRKLASPQRIFLVIDSMVGQDAVRQAEHFNSRLDVSGVILSKLDGDARGGVALSVRHAIGKPIVFASVGEKPADFEAFHPDRMAGRILGMGDVLTLIEKAQAAVDREEALKMQQKLFDQSFTLDDWLSQMQQVKKMGGLSAILKLLPGLGGNLPTDKLPDEREMVRMEAIINSMTKRERSEPHIVQGSRRKRIAAGSGANVSDVDRVIKEFGEMKRMIKAMTAPARERLVKKLRTHDKKALAAMARKGKQQPTSKAMRKMGRMGGLPGFDPRALGQAPESPEAGGADMMEKLREMLKKKN